ncbi:class I SAM-dependent methyltransferase [Phaeodactylibacter luteus]|uniref:Class I SAM-dependent methyltransferase n=1 Tax=Phaeodactylibacter luteus TaxID=1564516 RepID=A0A5C6S4X4_9BACT|nr:class I SAM-dependent methyltransferase [Phaeodactylibacter luteus]TXB69546.1 class I SAM-dependent methyltransferase [Phaeodactylibacter luteus]
MNYKLLFPTYRNRYTFVRRKLEELSEGGAFGLALNLGTGEGDYDHMVSRFCTTLIACDINEADVAYAQKLNQGVPNLSYRVENALALSFPDNHFDLITSVDVIEHVGQPARMMEEVQRVLKPGGAALITFPNLDFPLTYDPINRLLRWLGQGKIAQGAYAFGHEYLVSGSDFRGWAKNYGLEVVEEHNLSGHLIGLLEMYWTGVIQRLFKANATNLKEQPDNGLALRPTTKEPALAKLTDSIIALDRALFGKARHAVGKGFLVRKPHPVEAQASLASIKQEI